MQRTLLLENEQMEATKKGKKDKTIPTPGIEPEPRR